MQVGVTARAGDAAAERQKCHRFLRMFSHLELPPVISVFSSKAGSNHAAAAAVSAAVSDPSQQAVNKKGTNPLQIFIRRSYFYAFVEVGVHLE